MAAKRARAPKTVSPEDVERSRRFGAYLKFLQADLPMSQADMARRADVSPPQMSRICRGKKPQLTATELLKICLALGLDPFKVWLYASGRSTTPTPPPAPPPMQ